VAGWKSFADKDSGGDNTCLISLISLDTPWSMVVGDQGEVINITDTPSLIRLMDWKIP